MAANNLHSATKTVNIRSAAAPSANQFLTASSSTTATWQSTQLQNCSVCSISAPAAGQNLSYNGTQWQNQKSNLLNINLILFLNVSMLTANNYILSGLYNAVFCDQTNVTSNSFITLPTLSGNGTQKITIQGLGTIGSNQIGISFGINYIYTGSGSYAIQQSFGTNTIVLTYYASSGNHWGSSYPSYCMTTVGSGELPLNSNVDLFLVYSNNYNSVTGIAGLPNTLVYGQQLRIRDLSRYLNTTQIQLKTTNSNNIDGNTTETLNTANLSKLYTYFGGGSSGNLISL